MDKIKKALEQAREQRYSYERLALKESPKKAAYGTLENRDYNGVTTNFQPEALTLERNRILNKASRKEIVQPFKVLRTRLMHIMEEKEWSTVAVLSPTKDDGKTTVAINLAISIAKGLDRSAVLLDLDLMTPSIHSYFDYLPEYGLDDYYEHEASLNDIFITPGINGLFIAPSVRPLQGSSEYLASDKSRELIASAKSRYPDAIVLIDLPPVLVSDDAIAMIPFIDAVLLVVREGHTNKQDVERSLEMLATANIAGVVLNDSLEPTELGYY